MRLLLVIALPILIAACDRAEERDPFVVPGALKMETIDYRGGEEAVAQTALGRALPRVEDPCGGPAGGEGVSEAWVRSRVIAAGHDAETFCQNARWARDGGRPPSDPNAPLPSVAESRARMAAQDDYLRLMAEANANQVELLNRQRLADAQGR